MPGPRTIPRVLTIAGSDSGGGAGIQADLKAFAAAGVHGMTAITAITAQNTVSVTAVHHLPAEMIVAQVAAINDDIGIDAVKIGMLGHAATVRAVSRALDLLPAGVPVVLDPVMVSESGAVLLEDEARQALIEQLLPRASVLTPNLPEARALVAGTANREIDESSESSDVVEVEALARALHRLGPPVVIVTGGHRRSGADFFFDGHVVHELPGPRHPDGAAHGSGCTHSSVLAARLAWGDTPLPAAKFARALTARAVAQGLREIGAGAGPVDVLGLSGIRPELG